MGVSVFPLCQLFGLKHPRIRAWGLLGWTRSQCHYGGLPGELSQQVFLGPVPQVSFPPIPPPTESQCMLAFIPLYGDVQGKGDSSWNPWNYGDSEQHQWPTCLQDRAVIVAYFMSLRGGSHTLPGQQGQQPNLDFNSSLFVSNAK